MAATLSLYFTGLYYNNVKSFNCISHLLENGHTCELQDTTKYTNIEDFRQYLAQKQVHCIIGIHLVRAGRLLLECSVPFLMVFGGTDLNQHSKQEDKMKIMTQIVHQAKILVAFSQTMALKAKELWPEIESKIVVQSQGVCVTPSTFSEQDLINIMKENAIPEDRLHLETIKPGTMVLFLLVAGLRPVKDPMFLFNVMSEWHKNDKNIYFLVIGPEVDREFSHEVKIQAKKYAGVIVVAALAQNDLHAIIKHCAKIVVNTSISEGMASSILEAMELETVVLARNIPGNQSIIEHNKNGLLFDSPEEFLSLATTLISDYEQYCKLVENGKRFIKENHGLEKEKLTYQTIIKDILKK